jgi:hypothetical protein
MQPECPRQEGRYLCAGDHGGWLELTVRESGRDSGSREGLDLQECPVTRSDVRKRLHTRCRRYRVTPQKLHTKQSQGRIRGALAFDADLVGDVVRCAVVVEIRPASDDDRRLWGDTLSRVARGLGACIG